jgi:hypothetical protein
MRFIGNALYKMQNSAVVPAVPNQIVVYVAVSGATHVSTSPTARQRTVITMIGYLSDETTSPHVSSFAAPAPFIAWYEILAFELSLLIAGSGNRNLDN